MLNICTSTKLFIFPFLAIFQSIVKACYDCAATPVSASFTLHLNEVKSTITSVSNFSFGDSSIRIYFLCNLHLKYARHYPLQATLRHSSLDQRNAIDFL